MKALGKTLLLVTLVLVAHGCCQTKDAIAKYNPVESAIREVQSAVFGDYGDTLPVTFTRDSLTALLTRRERVNEIDVLKNYTIDLKPLKGSYVIFVYDGPDFVLFDYGCTPDTIDGPVYRKNLKFFMNHVPCTQ